MSDHPAVVRIPRDLCARMDVARGDTSRALWVRRLIERELNGVDFKTFVRTQNALVAGQAHLPTCRCPVCKS